jgi:ubiquinone/menaquinone biosynthesis C-methylase UbiE
MNLEKRAWPRWCCPIHRTPLTDRGDVLACAVGEIYPRMNGVPRFVNNAKYAAGFGAQWKKYRLTQLDSYTRTTISKDRARRCMGEDLWAALADKQVLECGCGAGRFTEILLAERAHVTSIDLSEAVDANQDNFPQTENHRIAQADLLHLPFEPR